MRQSVFLVAVLAGAGRAQDEGVEQWLADVCAARPNADQAYARLAAAGPQAFPQVLAALLDDQSGPVKVRLSTLLARYAASMESTEPYLPDLRRLLSEKSPEVLGLLCPVLAKAGTSLIPALERLFASPDAAVRTHAARAIGTFGPAAFSLIRKNLASTSTFRCEAALTALAAAGDPAREFTDDVRPFLVDNRPALRSAAASAFGAIAPDRRDAARTLLPMLADPDPDVAVAAAAALELHAAERLPDLIDALAESRGALRDALMLILGRLPEDAAPAYERALLIAPAAARNALLEAISFQVVDALSPGARERIIAWTADPDVSTRIAALSALKRAAWPDAQQALSIGRAAAKATEAAVRAAALRGLGGDPATARELCADPDEVVRMEAAWVLFRYGEDGPDPLPLCIALVDRIPEASERIAQMGAYALPAIPHLVRAADSPTCGRAARRALESVLNSPPADAVVGRPSALARVPDEIEGACQAALQWLANAQEADGHWDGVHWGAAPNCDEGLTGLALLAFLSAGHTDWRGAHAWVVRKALGFLVASQRDDGCLATRITHTFLIQHAIATTALSEAATVCRARSPPWSAKRALQFISLMRNPDMAWRYVPRNRENDTFVTTWMVMALKTGEMTGLHRDPAGCEGALRWIDKMTEPTFGFIGYQTPGSVASCPKELGSLETVTPPPLRLRPAKPGRGGLRPFELERTGEAPSRNPERSHSCTAAGLWVRVLTGSGLQSDVEGKSLSLLKELPPVWYAQEHDIDECYWHWGALVAAQQPRPAVGAASKGASLTSWRDALTRELLAHQAADGSWDPVGVWGRTGGRVFSTSMATLALLAPYAYPEGCFAADYRRKLYPEAYKLLGR